MNPDQITTILLGPVGVTFLALIIFYLFLTERLTPGKRTERAEQGQRDALRLVQDAVNNVDKMATALAERNRIDEERLRVEREQLGGRQERRQTGRPVVDP